jgi:hypothetical protein
MESKIWRSGGAVRGLPGGFARAAQGAFFVDRKFVGRKKVALRRRGRDLRRAVPGGKPPDSFKVYHNFGWGQPLSPNEIHNRGE